MRAHLAGLMGGLVLLAAALTGCGDDAGVEATDGDQSSAVSPSDSSGESAGESADPGELSSVTPNGDPVGVRKTCAELYHPPGQWMPLAIEFVHGSPSADPAGDAGAIVDGLADVAGHALAPLAEDIAVVRVGVDAQRASLESGSGEGPDLAAFDAAQRRLGHHCELYND